MRALKFERFGNFNDVLRVVEVDLPVPRAGEVLVKVTAASVNPGDAKNILGRMEGTTLPRIPGQDFAGVGVGGPTKMIGTEIWGSGGDIGFARDGAHAEYIVIPQESVTTKPAHLSMIEAAAVGTSYVTAYLGLIETANVQASEWVMVTGATGGVEGSAIQLAIPGTCPYSSLRHIIIVLHLRRGYVSKYFKMNYSLTQTQSLNSLTTGVKSLVLTSNMIHASSP